MSLRPGSLLAAAVHFAIDDHYPLGWVSGKEVLCDNPVTHLQSPQLLFELATPTGMISGSGYGNGT